jgi:hypothetical protein
MNTVYDLLNTVEQETGRKFIVANFAGASHIKGQQYWFDYDRAQQLQPVLFSNRPFPKTRLRRHSENAPTDERFIRVDLEFDDHTRVPTEAELQELADWGQKAGAIGMLDTKHGAHMYFLTDQPFPWVAAKSLISSVIRTYSGKMQVCGATYAKTNWSKTHGKSLRFYSAKNRVKTQEHKIYIYCEPSTSVSSKKINNLAGGSAQTFQGKAKFISEPEKHAEFSAILKRVIRGERLENIPMLYHKPEVLARTFQRPEYSWVNSTQIRGGINFAGVDSHSRPIQRDFSFFGHLRHSLADLAYSNYTQAGYLKVFCTSQYDSIRTQLIARVGEDKWMQVVEENIEALRSKYAGKVGLYSVSPQLIKQVFELIYNRRKINANIVQQWFKKKNPQRNKHHTARGTSIATAKRVVALLKSCGIIGEDGIVLTKGNKILLNQCIAASKKHEEVAITEEKTVKKEAVTPNFSQTSRPNEGLFCSAETISIREPEVCGIPRTAGHGDTSYEGEDWRTPE